MAKIMMSFPVKGSIEELAQRFLNDNVKTKEDAIQGASYIIAEYISDNAYFRKWIRSFIYRTGMIACKKKKDALDEEKTYEMYYEYQVNLLKRKEDVIRLIDEKGLLTDELKNKIMEATKLVEVEDLYRPFKEKKKTKATEAI